MSIINDRSSADKPKAKRSTIQFCPNVFVDGYRILTTDEFRVGIQGASLVLGYEQSWLYQLVNRKPKALEALMEWGFSNLSVEVEIVNMGEGRGRNTATTISIPDFNCLIGYAVDQRRPKAIALDKGLRAVALESFFRQSFGLNIDQSVLDPFYKEYAKTIDWLGEDKDDWKTVEFTDSLFGIGISQD